MKRIFLILTLPLLLGACSVKTPEPEGQPPAQAPAESHEAADVSNLPDTVNATITMEDGGVIELELYPKIAPQSVYNFVALARSGFYDGLTFHRIKSGFMIQGGDPDGSGTGGPGYGIKGEFAQNGFANPLRHTRGVLSMARQGDPMYDSAGSQFFIVHEDSTFLDGAYAGFGKVTSGMDVVDRIASVSTDRYDRPLEEVKMKSVTIQGADLPEPTRIK